MLFFVWLGENLRKYDLTVKCRYSNRILTFLWLLKIPASAFEHIDLERVADEILVNVGDSMATRHRFLQEIDPGLSRGIFDVV